MFYIRFINNRFFLKSTVIELIEDSQKKKNWLGRCKFQCKKKYILKIHSAFFFLENTNMKKWHTGKKSTGTDFFALHFVHFPTCLKVIFPAPHWHFSLWIIWTSIWSLTSQWWRVRSHRKVLCKQDEHSVGWDVTFPRKGEDKLCAHTCVSHTVLDFPLSYIYVYVLIKVILFE